MNKWIISLTVMLPTLIEIIDISVVNVALDHIRGSLSAGIDESTWAITSYLVSNAIIIPMTGWLSRLFGRKRYMIFSISLFTLSSLLCGSAWNLQSLIVFRILQGIGGGALQPISQSILLETFPPRQHGMAMAIFGVGIMFGPIIGPLLGGWITDNWSWHWIFFISRRRPRMPADCSGQGTERRLVCVRLYHVADSGLGIVPHPVCDCGVICRASHREFEDLQEPDLQHR
jgi:DHA2 family multidrug resistance protein